MEFSSRKLLGKKLKAAIFKALKKYYVKALLQNNHKLSTMTVFYEYQIIPNDLLFIYCFSIAN